MEQLYTYSLKELQKCPYRSLQRVAKNLSLPCNVKKIYLIQMIYTRKHGTPEELDDIVYQMKLERQKATEYKKKNVVKTHKTANISSKNSPPIMTTPKRPAAHIIVSKSPNRKPVVAIYKSKACNMQSSSTIDRHTAVESPKINNNVSDRVLRSFKIKTSRRPSYIYSDIPVFNVVKPQNSANMKTIVEVINHEDMRPNVCLPTSDSRSMLKYKPSAKTVNKDNNSCKVYYKENNEIKEGKISTSTNTNINQPKPVPCKRRLSGISTINGQEPSKSDEPKQVYDGNLNQVYIEYKKSMGFRRQDGKYTKINAVVQKPIGKASNFEIFDTPITDNGQPTELTIQDIIDSNVETFTQTNTNIIDNLKLQYPNMSSMVETFETPSSEKQCDMKNLNSEYYHKKIRAEQVRERRMSLQIEVSRSVGETLPNINDTFSRFNYVSNVSDIMKPLHVQVSEESERFLNYPLCVKTTPCNSNMLETLHNFKNSFITNQPLLQISTTTNTKCVFSTSITTTATVQQPISLACNEQFNVSSLEADNQFEFSAGLDTADLNGLSEGNNGIPLQDIGQCDDMAASCTSDTTQDLGANVTITDEDMVEDALELISQDGDYMERIGLDVRMQCVICSWAGPKILMEYHIRKNHADEIEKQTNPEWNVTYTLGSLVNRELWICRVVEHMGVLYALSAKYDEPDCFRHTLSLLSFGVEQKTASMTLYNRVNGKPCAWEGPIQELPTNLPYENDSCGLKVELSKMDLLPNNANITSKTIVGHPQLNDIHIIVFIKILSCD